MSHVVDLVDVGQRLSCEHALDEFSSDSGRVSSGLGLRSLISSKDLLRFVESHSPMVSILASDAVSRNGDGVVRFDGLWSSSLSDSVLRGKPDMEVVDLSTRLATVGEIREVSDLPIIFDGDTGGLAEHFAYTVRTLERAGVSAVVIEDKTGLKRNSLFGTSVVQLQEDVESFCRKIHVGKSAQRHEDFMIFARIESLILDKGMDDALARARSYVRSGCDGIMIHSRSSDGLEIMEFLRIFRSIDAVTPVITVPTSYSSVRASDLASAGSNIVVYANHAIRASALAIRRVLCSILEYDRSFESEDNLLKTEDLLKLTHGDV